MATLTVAPIAAQPPTPPSRTTTHEGGGAFDDDYYTTTAIDCDQIRPYHRRLNALTIARSVAGGIAVLLCTLSAMHIFGHGRDRRSLPTRLALGMLLANLVYAITDAIPVHLVHLSGDLCGFTAIGPHWTETNAECLPTAVMFFGAWCTTMYELAMVLVSTRALRTGVSVLPAHHERAIHLICIGPGVAALLGFFIRCREILLEIAAIVEEADYKNRGFSDAQAARFHQAHEANRALPGLLWGWALGPVVLAFLSWIYQRRLYRSLLKDWKDARARHRAFVSTDVLAMIGLERGPETRSRLLQLRREAYTEVVERLEPYIVVIFVFAIPQAIGVSAWCWHQTQSAFQQGEDGNANGPMPCENTVQLVLSFRSIALAMVYLWDPTTRAEAFDIPELFRRSWARIAGTGRTSGGVRFPANEIDGIALVPVEGEGRSTSFAKADTDVERMGFMASRSLRELDAAADTGHDGGPAGSKIPYQRME